MFRQKNRFLVNHRLFFSSYVRPFNRYYFLFIILLFQGCSSEIANTKSTTQLPQEEHKAKVPIQVVSQGDLGELSGTQRIVFDKMEYDLGEIKPGSTNKATFSYRNAGGKPLKITDVKKCCGAVVNLDKRELAPGESGVLTAEYHTGQGAGVLNKKITLFTDDPENPQTELAITGKVIQTLEWTPARFELSAYDKDNTCPDIVIKSLDGTPFSIKGFTATGQCLTTDFDPNVEAQEFTLKPILDVAKLQALPVTTGRIRIDVGHRDYETIHLGFNVAGFLCTFVPMYLCGSQTKNFHLTLAGKVRTILNKYILYIVYSMSYVADTGYSILDARYLKMQSPFVSVTSESSVAMMPFEKTKPILLPGAWGTLGYND